MALKRHAPGLALLMTFAVPSGPAAAEPVSLFQSALPMQPRAPLIALRRPAAESGPERGAASLFIGQDGTSLFAPFPEPPTRLVRRGFATGNGSRIERVRQLIGRAEAGKQGYDAVQLGAKTRPPKRPTDMTIAEIYDWIDKTPGQPHAIGRYQFIPATLRRLVQTLGVSPQTLFSPQLQDRLADILLAEAGLDAFVWGEIGRQAFMNNMAKIWAGLPTSSGKSYYDGFAGNRATMTWARFDTEMRRIFPG